MAGRSQHGDNRSSYFSADLGRSGVYDSVNGTPINFSQGGDNPNDLRNTEGISETARESGLYASRIGSIKQPIEDYSKETIGSTDNFHRQNWDQSFEEGNRTPESGTYSRNIESHQRGGMDYKENDDINRSSTFDNTRDSGLYSRKIGSFRETIPDKDVATPFPDNPGLDNQRQSGKNFKPNKYTGNTLETMLEGEDESKQAEHYHSTYFSESRKISDTRSNTDYDGHSNASFQDDKEIPTWTDMMFDRQFTDEYIKKKWPKITLPLSNTRKNDPFVPGIVDEGSITIDEKSGTHDHKVRNTLCVIGLGTLLLCLVGAAIITIALLADQRTDKTEYVKVNMTVAINKTFTAGLNDSESTEYKTFTTEFCSEMKNVYASSSSSVDGYFGCKVIQLTDGSIFVNYVIYFISTANQQVTSDTVSTTLTTHLTVSGTQLGSLVVITSTIIVHNVVTETLESPPAVDKIATTTTIKSTIETTTNENVPSTGTTPAAETVQQTEATRLVTMQSTMETTSLTIASTKETTPNNKQSTAEKSTHFISSTQGTTPKTMQSTTDTGTPTLTSTGATTSKTMQPKTETTTPLITSPGETTPKTVQSTTETTIPSITSPGETTQKNVQSTTETTTPSISSTGETTLKDIQSTTDITTPSITSTGDTTPKTVQSTTETTTPSISSTDETTQQNMQSTMKTATPSMSSTEKTTPVTIQSTTDTTTHSISSTEKTTPKTMQSTTDTKTPSISSTDETTQKNMQSTTETTTPSILPTDETTPKGMQSTTTTTTPSISSTEKTTLKIMQSTTETTTPLILPTIETTPKFMQSKISTPTISSTEEIPQNTMHSTKETTISLISTTQEPMSNPSTDQVSEETTTQQTFKTTDGTSTTTGESIQIETSTTQEKNSNEDTTITIVHTTPVIVTSPSFASTIKETSTLSTTDQTPEMTTSAVTTKPTEESTTSGATMLNGKTTTTSITQSTTKPVTVTDYVTPTIIDVTTRTTHIPFLSETTSPVSSAKTEIQTTFTQSKETTHFVALTDRTQTSVKVSTMDETTSRSITLSEDMTPTTFEDETTVSTSRIDTSSDKTSLERSTSEVPTSKETTGTLGNVQTTTSAYDPSSDSTSTSHTPTSVELNCTDAAEADLHSGPVTMECTVKKSEQFEYIGIYHGNGFDNTIYGVLVYKNGTIFKTYKEHQDISINIESTSTIQLMITFINVTCAMDGSYKVVLISNISGEMNEVIGRNVLLKIRSPAGKPTLTLNADQVIDLVFPDGNYYRGTGTHTCEGLIGEPPAKLEIDITYDNGTNFEQIPNSSIDLSRNITSDECSIKETVSFGLKFSSEMDGARLRCRVPESMNDFTLSDELSLIPRNICNCGASFSYRGHPNNCKVQVYCVTEGGIAYPTGIACTSNQCRNSITGDCGTDCSDTVCNEAVPSDFCTTPAPPTTTSAPSPYIICTDTSALVNSGPAVITCYLNDTATFTVMNVTYMKLGESAVQQIASIDDSGDTVRFAMDDIVSISMSNYIINITILNPSCENDGTFAVVTEINGESVMDQGKFSVISKPSGDATLQLHPDQIAGLDKYRSDFLHTCEINVGYPPGEISIEMLKQGAAEFQKLNVNFHTHIDRVDNTTCSITRTALFGILFTSDMDKATIRCSVSHDLFPNDQLVYSNNDTVSLIPIDFCKNNIEALSFFPHPTNCYSFVQCEVDITYSKPCPSGQCFGVFETGGCNFCNDVTCPADITTTPVPDSSTSVSFIEKSTTPEATFSNDVYCNSSTVVWNSGPVDMECKLNSSNFSILNVTYRASAQSVPSVISVIQSNGHINDLNQYDGITVNYIDQLITISILNASCSSGDFYGVIVEDMHGNVEGKAEGKLIVGSNPSDDAVLKLHPDQIAGLGYYRSDNLHICEANVGYPGGEIQIEILNQGETEFEVLNVDFKKIIENTDTSCSITKKVSFGIVFTANMGKATLRCGVKSNLFPDDPLIYSNNATVSLIPNDFCEGTNASLNPHLTNCHYFIECVGELEYGKQCQSNLCFGIKETNGCQFCSSTICPSDITTTSKPETTVPVPSIDISCSDSTVLLNTGPGVIVCSVNTTSFSIMNVTYQTSPGLTPTLIAVIQSDGNVEATNNTDLIVVTYTSFTVTISVLNVSCTYEGYYGVIIDSGSDLTGKSEGKLSTSAHPSGPVAIVINYDQIIDLPRTFNVHTCSGQVGKPQGKIEVEILFDGSNDFQILSLDPSHTSSISTTEHCIVTEVFTFWIGYTSSMYNATIRCKMINEEFQTVPAIYSKNETLTPVPNNFCDINYNGTNSYPNTADPCNRFVTCIEKTPYGKRCSAGTCFDPESGGCGHCRDVDSCS